MEVISKSKLTGILGIIAGLFFLISLAACNKVDEYNSPSVNTGELSNITETSVFISGEVTDIGSYDVTDRGFVWNTTGVPVISSDDTMTIGVGKGIFSATIEDLLPSTKYYIRAYATNRAGSKYGGLKNFWTLGPPVVYTYYAYGVTSTSATLKGHLTYIGDHPVTKMGMCWSLDVDPDLTDNVLEQVGNDSTFVFNITGLEPLTIYYLNSFAITEVDTSFGQIRSFTTLGGFVNDIEGNEYEVVRIGEQFWLSKNLNVTKYNDNTPIEKVDNPSDWNVKTTPAYCVYNNSDILNDTYGLLYNWYAVDAGNLCPDGWHVATDNEWLTLETYLGENAADKIKDTEGDWSSIGDATNETNFSALPGGYRGLNGVYSGLERDAAWWSTDESGANYAWLWEISTSSSGLARNSYSKNRGNSVRCVKD